MEEYERQISSKLEDIIAKIGENGGELVPFLKDFFNHVRMNRFQKRINQHESKINTIFKLISEKDIEFYSEKVGLPVFEKILEDHEDEKAEFLLLGFENCVNHGWKEEDLLLLYFDLLTELRVAELKRLFTLSKSTKENPELPVTVLNEESMLQHIDKKLNRLGLINAPKTYSTLSGDEIDYSRAEDITASTLGENLLEFIYC